MGTYQDGFKVLVVVEGKRGKEYYSATCLGRVTRYYPNRETPRPPDCGPLTVFTTRELAERWWKNQRGFQVSRCKYQPSADLSIWVTSEIWSTWRQPVLREFFPYLPAGTALADVVIIEP